MTITLETTEWQKAPAVTKKPFVAIGDIHGCAHLLSALRTHLDAEAPHRRIYLGDFIDPYTKYVPNHDVAGVIDQIAADLDRGAVALAGNHELMMLNFVNAARAGEHPDMRGDLWPVHNDGGATILSFSEIETLRRGGYEAGAVEMFDRKMTERQRGVFRNLKTHLEIGKYICIHAGFLPDLPWRKQINESDWFKLPAPDPWSPRPHPFWNRLHGDEGPRGRVQINGHTPLREPFVGKRRIAIDSGAKIGGPLTGVEIVADRLRFHHACPTGVTMLSWGPPK